MEQFAIVLVLSILVIGVNGQNEAPRFTDNMNGLTLLENLPLGTEVYTLRGTDAEGAALTYGIISDAFEVRDSTNGKVYLKRALDFEREVTIQIQTWISDGVNNVVHDGTVTVDDYNDELPEFTEETYKYTVREDAPVDTTFTPQIDITDKDKANSLLTVRCNDTHAQFSDACDVFGLVVTRQSNLYWSGNLVLEGTLDYERRSVYQVLLSVFDGLNIVYKSIEVNVDDVQDSPPQFTSAMTAVVTENTALGSPVLLVKAEDGDQSNPRIIIYRLVSNPGGFFSIQEDTGQITIADDLDRENDRIVGNGGAVVLTVRACEVINSTHISDDDLGCTQADVIITVTDLNDNTPAFNQPSYTSSIDEDVANDTPLPNLNLVVTDNDQGESADFELILTNHNDIFKVVPTIGSTSLQANILVKDSSLIDFDEGLKSYTLSIIARETKSPERLSSTATVLVNIQDVNDNYPMFPEKSYSAQVLETATGGTPVITITATDKDSGNNGEAGLRYRLLGNGADKFRVGLTTGKITVKTCYSPGRWNCLDYEQRSEYSLTFETADRSGEGKFAAVPLTIKIIDDNDNMPKFPEKDYVAYIYEGDTIPENPPLKVEAADADSDYNGNNRIRYTIVSGNSDGVWQIGSESGVITATRPVDYEATPGNTGVYLLTIKAEDRNPDSSDSITVKIYVIDQNDHDPIFTQNGYYEQSILETTPPGTVVETVSATDNDPDTGPNGQIQYRIASGAQDKFVIDPNSGVIRVAPSATFDFDQQNQYNMKVMAEDKGQPQKSATAQVVVNIRDANNKDPYFFPTTVRRDIREDAGVGDQLVKMNATDPDSDAALIYYFEDPIQGTDSQGNPVDHDDIKDLFTIDRDSGLVTVNSDLDRDTVAQLTITVKAVDSAGADQSATATLIVTILDVNDEPPIFGYPWTPDRPFITIDTREDQPAGSYITSITADDSDGISQYTLINDPGRHFKINTQTGAVTVNNTLDYEKEQYLQFVVLAKDNGQPALTATATVNVNVLNVNDENPYFNQTLYQVGLLENSPGGTVVTQVYARDNDLEDYGVVRYSLDDPHFEVNPITGIITVKDGAILDRESEDTVFPISITAYDSPLDDSPPGGRRFASVPVYITLTDENDNPPEFEDNYFRVNILETIPVYSSVLQLIATDRDVGENADLEYVVVAGDPNGLFYLDRNSGLVSTNRSLEGFDGEYNVTVAVRDTSPVPQTTYAYVSINVNPVGSNNAPIWVIPARANFTVEVLENSYIGIEVIEVDARDDDEGPAGEVEYYFMYNGQVVSETPNFKINRLSGSITARVSFDREVKDTYTLQLLARDRGLPPFETPTILIVNIGDVNDHIPEFPTYGNCCSIPAEMTVYEDLPVDTRMGQVVALDKDIGANAEIFYEIEAGNQDDKFYIDEASGNIYLGGELDREIKSVYVLTIRARNKDSIATEILPQCKCRDPDVVILTIYVLDRNDGKPSWSHNRFNACVPMDAAIGHDVAVMRAIDADGIDTLTYSLTSFFYDSTSGTKEDADMSAFTIGGQDGVVSTASLMTKYENHYFILGVRAVDPAPDFSDTSLYVYVTEPSKEVIVTFDDPKEVVEENLDEYMKILSEQTNGGIVCVEDLRFHVDATGTVIRTRTDLVIYVIDPRTNIILDPDAVMGLLGGTVSAVASAPAWAGFVIDPVVIAIILIILLLLLALLLLCLCCFCCGAAGAKEKHAYGIIKQPLVATALNPIYTATVPESQELSMHVKDYDTVDAANLAYSNAGYVAYNATDTLDRSYHSEFYSGGSTLINGEIPRIEAPLDGNGVAGGTSSNYISRYESTNVQNTDAASNAGGTASTLIDTTRVNLFGMRDAMSEIGAGNARVDNDVPDGGFARNDLIRQSNVHVERTQMGSYEATFGGSRARLVSRGTATDDDDARSYAGYSNRRPQKIGATLTRMGERSHSQEILGDVRDSSSAYHASGFSTLPANGIASRGVSVSSGQYLQVPRAGRSGFNSFADDGEVSQVLNTSHHGSDFPGGFYEGEINLRSPSPVPIRGHVTESRYERREVLNDGFDSYSYH